MVRTMLSESLEKVIAQRLLRKPEGGRMATYEIMVGTSAIRNLIRENKVPQIYGMMQTGREYAMVTMGQSLQNLAQEMLITLEIARSVALDPEKFD